jgi:hypothetical protein
VMQYHSTTRMHISTVATSVGGGQPWTSLGQPDATAYGPYRAGDGPRRNGLRPRTVLTCEQVRTRAVTADKRCMDSLLVCFEG